MIKKENIKFLLQLFFMVTIIITSLVITLNSSKPPVNEDEFNKFDGEWNCIVNGTKQEYDSLPENVCAEVNHKYILEKKLPEDLNGKESLIIYFVHNYFKVSVDGKEIKSIEYDENGNSKTPGCGWVFVNLENEYAGKTLQIEVYAKQSRYSGRVPLVYIGTESAAIMNILKENMVAIVICTFIFFAGLCITLFYIIYGKKINVGSQVLWLGIVAIIFSIWSFSDLSIAPLFNGRYLVWSQMSFICLYLTICPVVNIFRTVFKVVNKKLDIAMIVWTSCLGMLMVLQLLGIMDLCQWITVNNCVGMLMILWIMYESIKRIKNVNKNSGYFYVLIFLSVMVFIDGFRYFLCQDMDTTFFSRIGFFVAYIAMVSVSLKDTFVLYCENKQLKEYKKSALIDELTKCANRMAFEKDCQNIGSEKKGKYGIIMCDLNNLKQFNDQYGHSAGDYYIIICSEILQDLFGTGEGRKVYRIGGDEFCAISKDISYEDYSGMIKKMNEHLSEINNQCFNKKMEIATGYAKFVVGGNDNIHDIVKKADDAMYDNKKKMKQEAEQ